MILAGAVRGRRRTCPVALGGRCHASFLPAIPSKNVLRRAKVPERILNGFKLIGRPDEFGPPTTRRRGRAHADPSWLHGRGRHRLWCEPRRLACAGTRRRQAEPHIGWIPAGGRSR